MVKISGKSDQLSALVVKGVMFDTRTRLFFFACLNDAAGAALKSAAPAPGSDQQKNRLRLRPKSGGSGSATLPLSLAVKN